MPVRIAARRAGVDGVQHRRCRRRRAGSAPRRTGGPSGWPGSGSRRHVQLSTVPSSATSTRSVSGGVGDRVVLDAAATCTRPSEPRAPRIAPARAAPVMNGRGSGRASGCSRSSSSHRGAQRSVCHPTSETRSTVLRQDIGVGGDSAACRRIEHVIDLAAWQTIGLWNIAAATPQLTAVIDAGRPGGQLRRARRDGRPDTAGACRRLGLGAGDCVVVHAAQRRRAGRRSTSPPCETGLYIVPINWHLTGAEVAYIVEDCGAKVFVGARAVRRGRAGRPPTRPASPPDGPVRGRRDRRVPAARPSSGGRRPGRPATGRQGAPMDYTSGTTGQPKGVRRPLTGADPDRRAAGRDVVLRPVRDRARTTDNVHICAARRSTTPRC